MRLWLLLLILVLSLVFGKESAKGPKKVLGVREKIDGDEGKVESNGASEINGSSVDTQWIADPVTPTPTPPCSPHPFGESDSTPDYDSSDSNNMSGNQFNTANYGGGGIAISISVFVGSINRKFENTQFQLAIYSDNGDVPNALLTVSEVGNLVPYSWNTLPIPNITLLDNTKYWLMYNTNGVWPNDNDYSIVFPTGGLNVWSDTREFLLGFPSVFPAIEDSDTIVAALYASLLCTNSSGPTPTPTPTSASTSPSTASSTTATSTASSTASTTTATSTASSTGTGTGTTGSGTGTSTVTSASTSGPDSTSSNITPLPTSPTIITILVIFFIMLLVMFSFVLCCGVRSLSITSGEAYQFWGYKAIFYKGKRDL